MNKIQAKDRIEKLKKLVNYHRHLYHVLDRQEISDEALDSLKKELFDLEQQFPDLITDDSPTQRVGGQPLKEFKKVPHRARMLSLNDVFSQQDLNEWRVRIAKLLASPEQAELDFYCELKIDGLAMELEYKNGFLVRGSTRGDGMVGEDITQNLKTVEAIPLVIGYKEPLVVRGEVYISKKEFAVINKAQETRGLPPYANPRNIAAGSVRQLDSKVTAERNLDSFAYDIIVGPPTLTHEQKHEKLKELGFKTNAKNRHCKTLQDIFHFYEHVGKMREKLAYEIDGVVVIVNDNALFEKLGVAGKAPRGAVAYKFAQSQAATVLEDIVLQVGRTGAVTPVAVLKPVQITGITVTRATLHNEDEINRLGIKIKDTVIVGRAGDVIPEVVKALPELRTGKEKTFAMPKHCPSCDASLEKSDGEVLWRCPNQNCFARQRRQFYHFVSRSAFNIDGLGPKIIDRLLDEGLVVDMADIFSLKEADLAGLERFAETSAKNLVRAIQEKRIIALPRFIYALGIRNVGSETAVDLARHFGDISVLKNAGLEEFDQIANVGPIVSASIYEWFCDKHNRKFLEKLLKKVTVEKAVATGSKLAGKTFVLTGTMEAMGRDEAKEKVRVLGGQISESVSAKTDFLVAGENAGSKLEKAQKLGVKIIGEKEFLNLLET